MRRHLITAALAAIAPACDADVRCGADGDCPAALPFCVDDLCAATDDDDARVLCAADADCGRGLCYDVADDSGLRGSCVPPAGLDDACATALDEPTRSRDDAGPALISVEVGEGLGGCDPPPSYTITFRYFDREGDMPDPGSFTGVLFVREEAGAFASQSALVGSDVEGDDPAQAARVVFEMCGDPPLEPIAVWLEDSGAHRSNVVCAAP